MKDEMEQDGSSLTAQPSSFGRWWRFILGALLVLAGLATAILTLTAKQIGVPELTSIGAVASLVFVLLITVLVVPPLSRSAFAEIVLPNARSVKLHEALGFKAIGIHKDIGFKLGRWHDIGYWHMGLAEPTPSPRDPVPFAAFRRSEGFQVAMGESVISD